MSCVIESKEQKDNGTYTKVVQKGITKENS